MVVIHSLTVPLFLTTSVSKMAELERERGIERERERVYSVLLRFSTNGIYRAEVEEPSEDHNEFLHTCPQDKADSHPTRPLCNNSIYLLLLRLRT